MAGRAAGATAAVTRVVSARHRPRWRSYLLLARISNLPTVWSNVLAGTIAASAALGGPAFANPDAAVWAVVASSLFYTGGMFLNDAFDARFDRAARPERPIPRGEVGLGEAFLIGGVCLIVGETLLWPQRTALALGVALAAAIVFYDFRHKGNPIAPLVMGACRGLVYAIAAAVAVGTLPPFVLAGAVAMTLYVAGLTVVAKRAGANARWLVPALIAGISLVDTAFVLIALPAQPAYAVLAALGFPLTLFLQRYVPGD